MITAGIDCGAQNTKAVIIKIFEIIGRGSVSTGFDQRKAAEAALDEALANAGIGRGDIGRIGVTGSGKDSIAFADATINDIKAMARGAYFLQTDARTVVDVGAEEGRAVKINADGNPVDFTVNDKCAAGAGAFIEAMARALEMTLEEMGAMSLRSVRAIPLNAQCVIFAESEVVGLIHAETDKADISKAILDAIAGRTVSMIRRIGINESVVLIGGVARNPGFVAALKQAFKLDHIFIPAEPEFGAAIGAAVAAGQSK